jgi:hypothetical protein
MRNQFYHVVFEADLGDGTFITDSMEISAVNEEMARKLMRMDYPELNIISLELLFDALMEAAHYY